MSKKNSPRGKSWLRPRLRVMVGSEIALGPGRVELLELIQSTGSLRAAAQRMGVSYMRAWKLVKNSNRWFTTPLVDVSRGGKRGGGATLTKGGRDTITLYRRMEKQCHRAIRATWRDLQSLLIR